MTRGDSNSNNEERKFKKKDRSMELEHVGS